LAKQLGQRPEGLRGLRGVLFGERARESGSKVVSVLDPEQAGGPGERAGEDRERERVCSPPSRPLDAHVSEVLAPFPPLLWTTEQRNKTVRGAE